MNTSDLPFDGILPIYINFLGKKHSGKSVAIKYLCYEYRDVFSYIVVFSQSAHANAGYNFLPSKYVHTEYDGKIVQNIIDKQTKLWAAGKKIHCLLILDDVLGSENLKIHNPPKELITLFTQNRHYGISLFLTSQNIRSLPPVARQNADITFLYKQLNVGLKAAFEEFSHLPKKEFYELMDKYTNDWQIVVYNARAAAKNSNDAFSIFKVPEAFLHKSFTMRY